MKRLAALLLALASTPSAWGQACLQSTGAGANPDVLFAHGFDEASTAGGADPSSGSGGSVVPGNYTANVVLGGAIKTIHWRVPPNYQPGVARPILVLLHGSAGPGTQSTQAINIREYWRTVADEQGVFLLAATGSGSQGGWVEVDKARIEAAVAHLESLYTIDRSRRYLWGFSAGGHFSHVPALDPPQIFAAYGVNAGTLEAYAMPETQPSTAGWRTPVSLMTGTGDSVLPAMQRDRDRFLAAGWAMGADLRHEEVAGVGHTLTDAMRTPIIEFLCGFTHPAN